MLFLFRQKNNTKRFITYIKQVILLAGPNSYLCY